MPAVCARGAACEEEQRHDLHDPRDRGDRGQLAEQVADPQTAGVDRGEQQRAVPEHDDHQCGETGDVDGAVAAGRGVVGEPCLHRAWAWLRMRSGCRSRGPRRMSRTTRIRPTTFRAQPRDNEDCHISVGHDSKVLFVGRNVLANGRGRWLAVAASVAVSAAMLYAQGTDAPQRDEAAAVKPASPEAAPAAAPAPHRSSPVPRRRSCWRQARLSLTRTSRSHCPLASRRRRGCRSRPSGRPVPSA